MKIILYSLIKITFDARSRVLFFCVFIASCASNPSSLDSKESQTVVDTALSRELSQLPDITTDGRSQLEGIGSSAVGRINLLPQDELDRAPSRGLLLAWCIDNGIPEHRAFDALDNTCKSVGGVLNARYVGFTLCMSPIVGESPIFAFRLDSSLTPNGLRNLGIKEMSVCKADGKKTIGLRAYWKEGSSEAAWRTTLERKFGARSSIYLSTGADEYRSPGLAVPTEKNEPESQSQLSWEHGAFVDVKFLRRYALANPLGDSMGMAIEAGGSQISWSVAIVILERCYANALLSKAGDDSHNETLVNNYIFSFVQSLLALLRDSGDSADRYTAKDMQILFDDAQSDYSGLHRQIFSSLTLEQQRKEVALCKVTLDFFEEIKNKGAN